MGFGYENTTITQGDASFHLIEDFTNGINRGNYNIARFLAQWSSVTLNRSIFPTRGARLVADLEMGVGLGQSIGYLQADLEARWYWELGANWTVAFNNRFKSFGTNRQSRIQPGALFQVCERRWGVFL